MRSVNNRIRFGLVIWVSLLAFFSLAGAKPPARRPGQKTTPPALFFNARKAASNPAAPTIFLAEEAQELPDDFGKSFLEPAISPGFVFYSWFFKLPAGHLSYLHKRGAATPLYLRHCRLRI
jgi:hypothetical protein